MWNNIKSFRRFHNKSAWRLRHDIDSKLCVLCVFAVRDGRYAAHTHKMFTIIFILHLQRDLRTAQ